MARRNNSNKKKATFDQMSEIVGKIPPQNVEAEKSFLGSLLIDKNAIVKVYDLIKPEDFYRAVHGIIYKAMCRLYEKKMPIDLVTLTDILERENLLEEVGGASYLASLANSVPTASHVVYYAEIISQKAILRRLIEAAQNIAQIGYQEAEDVDTLLDNAERILFGVTQKYLKQEFIPLKDILSETFERIDQLHKDKGKLRGIPTGFDDIDNLLAGLQPSDLIVVASRPSMGKTTFALNIAANVAIKAKLPVGIFSLEMSKEQLVDRMLCAQAGVDSWKLRTGNLDDSDFPKIGYAMGVLSEAPLFIDDSPVLNVMEIRTRARKLKADHNLALLVIDYLQLIQGKSSSGDYNRVQEISEISRGLKALARELNVPVVTCSQLSRAVEMRPNHIPQLADLRESGCLTGDTLIFNPKTGRSLPIKNLVGKKNLPCLTLDKNLKLKTGHFSKVFPTGKKMVYEMKTATGRKIKASVNHPFLTLFGWRRLDELKKGDRIAVPRILPNVFKNLSKLNDNQLILLAHLLGDGFYLKSHALQYTNANQKCLEKVATAAPSSFDVQPRLVQQKNWHHLFLPATYKLTHNKRNPIVRWFDEDLEIFNQRSYEKIIPSQVFGLSKRKISLFLKHLWATDGTISLSRKGKGFGWAIFYAAKNEKMARQIQHLLLRYGIISRLRQSKKKNYKPGWFVDISGKNDQSKFLKEIGIYGIREEKVKKALKHLEKIQANSNDDSIPKEIWQYISKIKNKYGLSWRDWAKKYGMSYCSSTLFKHGISRDRLKKICRFLPDESLKNLANSDIYWDKIVSIKKLGIEEVFDATVPKTHNFVANDFIVENSIEQDADVVAFIYREDYYDKDSERKNIADILIKKHRNGPVGDVELYFAPEQLAFKNLEKKRKESSK